MIIDSAQKFYSSCESSRSTFLSRAREASELTIPFVLPPDGASSSTTYSTPFQGIGARGVNNLSSKLLLALLPPNSPFFRLVLNEEEINKIQDQQVVAEIEYSLSQMEQAVMTEVEVSALREVIFEALRHIIITGNALLYASPKKGIRVFHLDRYVVKRDPMGEVLAIGTKESISYDALPEEVQVMLSESEEPANDDLQTCDLYTAIYKEGKKYKVFQEVKGIRVPNSEGSFPIDKLPYIPLRYTRIDGENYGRGFVEEYLGDLISLEALSKSIVEGSAAAAKVVFLVNPNGTTRIRTLTDSPNGAVVQGNANDVTVLQMQKHNDFRVALETIETINGRLSYAFLLNSSVQRQAERVTAEEIRTLSQELESALGGLYSILASELQLPLVSILMNRMQKNKQLPPFPKKLIRPKIVTGVEALGRGNDLNKLDMFLAGANQTVGPEAIKTYLNLSTYFTRRATSLGIDIGGLIRSEEEIQEAMQQQQMQAMAEKLGPNAINAVSQDNVEQLKQEGNMEPPPE